MLCLAVDPPRSVSNESLVGEAIRLYVPKESIEKYKNSATWRYAHSINPLYPASSISLAKDITVLKTKTIKIEYSILPDNAGTKELEWSSSNSSFGFRL